MAEPADRQKQATEDNALPLSARLIAQVLSDIPAALRQRPLMLALDWSAATADQVDTLVSAASRAGRPPDWLLRTLLIAGHSVPQSTVTQLPAEAQALAILNAGQALPRPLVAQLASLSASGPLDPSLTCTLVEKLAQGADRDLACRLALAVWPEQPRALKPIKQAFETFTASMPCISLRIAGYSTTDTLANAMKPACAAAGLNAHVHVAPYGTALVELMDPREHCDAFMVMLDSHSLLEIDWRLPARERVQKARERISSICDAMSAFAQRSGKLLLVNTLPAPPVPFAGHFDGVDDAGAAKLTRDMNEMLARTAAKSAAMQVIDADCAMARLAPEARHDRRLWFYGRLAYSDTAIRMLALAFARAVAARQRGPAKVLALDFDNTLWGGVYGDDGLAHLICGEDPPGNAFRAFQHECLRLKTQGMLLVGLSKNNEDVLSVFETHQGMALRKEDFVATAINWEPKPGNMRRLAKELNLGLDSFVFLDDNPHEREAMRGLCPDVIVPELPEDPALRPAWLQQLVATWALRPTDEDARRTEMYRAHRDAEALKASAGTYEDYLLALQQTLCVELVTERTLARAAQLHMRTNQFNLTNRRFSEADLDSQCRDPQKALIAIASAKDRLGDHGIVAACAVSIDADTASIRSFVMSCRVIARTIETAFLGAIVSHLQSRGIVRIEGEYRPSAKNAVVKDFYRQNGFVPHSGDAGDAETWVWTAGTSAVPSTPYVNAIWSSS